jgi:hypothetical protein
LRARNPPFTPERPKESKRFFFEKKKQKTSAAAGPGNIP